MRLAATAAVAHLASLASAACDDVADGFASLYGGTTGGLSGIEVVVNNLENLRTYASAEGPHIIKVEGTITVDLAGKELEVASDKTIIGVGDSAHIENGGFGIHGVSNVIIRNLRITNPGDPDESDHDCIQADNSTNIWIDHCLFDDPSGDGLVDLRKDATLFTVSNTIFRNHDKTFGIGWTENVVAEGTIHHNWFDGTHQRNPSADNLLHAHLYNNYVTGVTGYGHYARGSTDARIENVYFVDTADPITADEDATLTSTGIIVEGDSGEPAADQGEAFSPSDFYDYKLDATEDVPSIVEGSAGPQAGICS
ncbi:uncharacterized protein DNG_08942 [Cephalotrichum gorgonifer]|uniref:Pectate lyase domain-containing protein n=1 Tax=Cephalotrichum gorgonifer TaxID=2041049 RepID=A0AAE8SYZ9_9PEZI|nr:uncharacterized protein DNG_08942 [Cephalotrichum gorgonifer]